LYSRGCMVWALGSGSFLCPKRSIFFMLFSLCLRIHPRSWVHDVFFFFQANRQTGIRIQGYTNRFTRELILSHMKKISAHITVHHIRCPVYFAAILSSPSLVQILSSSLVQTLREKIVRLLLTVASRVRGTLQFAVQEEQLVCFIRSQSASQKPRTPVIFLFSGMVLLVHESLEQSIFHWRVSPEKTEMAGVTDIRTSKILLVLRRDGLNMLARGVLGCL
jgi:hypothetical protein